MLIYNKITELLYDQFLILFVFEVIVILISIFVFKKRFSLTTIIYFILIALLLSLLTISITNGNYGGMAYHDHFGWPFQYYTVSRSIEGDIIPYHLYFDILKFVANTIYWFFIPFIILSEVFSKKKNKRYQLFIIISITIFALLTILFSTLNARGTEEDYIPEISYTQDISEEDMDIVQRKKEAIEKAYPDFKGFEENSSFAGTSVKEEEYNSDHYFVYIVNGSGIPIALGTCFKVDRMFRVYKIGEFPDPLDSYIGYTDIDPITCRGIK